MEQAKVGAITILLKALGDKSVDPARRQQVEAEFLDLVYPILRQKAGNAMRRERPGHTLGSTGLLHEVYIEIFREAEITWTDRCHFFNTVARKIREILVDHARRKAREKRGGGYHHVSLAESSEPAAPSSARDSDVTMIFEDVLNQLESGDPLAARVGEHHFFCGFTLQETAELLGTSLSTVEKKKKKIKDLVMEVYVSERLKYDRQDSGRAAARSAGGKESP